MSGVNELTSSTKSNNNNKKLRTHQERNGGISAMNVAAHPYPKHFTCMV